MLELEYKGFKIYIKPDQDPANPRTEWDNASTMTCFHKRYKLGDEYDKDIQAFKAWLQEKGDDLLTLPLYLYDHSGLAISTTPFPCQWDSGQVGYVYMDKNQVENEFGGDKTRALACMELEVKVYNQYLQGDVYCYIVCDSTGKVVRSESQIYGEDCAVTTAKEAVDRMVRHMETPVTMETTQESKIQIATLLTQQEHSYLCVLLQMYYNNNPIAKTILEKLTTTLETTQEADSEPGWLRGMFSIDLTKHLDFEELNEACDNAIDRSLTDLKYKATALVFQGSSLGELWLQFSGYDETANEDKTDDDDASG